MSIVTQQVKSGLWGAVKIAQQAKIVDPNLIRITPIKVEGAN